MWKPRTNIKKRINGRSGNWCQKWQLCDADSVSFEWQYKDVLIKVHYVGIFYKILEYSNDVKKDIEINSVNDDSLGADFYEISQMNKGQLSSIVNLELERLVYILNYLILYL